VRTWQYKLITHTPQQPRVPLYTKSFHNSKQEFFSSSRTVFLFRWDLWDTDYSIAFYIKETGQAEMYLHIGGTHGTQITQLLFDSKETAQAELYLYLGGTHVTQLPLLRFVVKMQLMQNCTSIQALSAHSAAKFNILPGRLQHVWLVAIVPPERWGEMDRNDCHTAWGNFKTLISSLHHYTNYACFFSLFVFFQKKCCYFYLSYLVLPSTGCKSQLF
jgi:hypothetical protein